MAKAELTQYPDPLPQVDSTPGLKQDKPIPINIFVATNLSTEIEKKRPLKVRLKIHASLIERWKDKKFRKKRVGKKHSKNRRRNIARAVEKKFKEDPLYRQKVLDNLRRINTDPKELERRKQKRKRYGKKAKTNYSIARRKFLEERKIYEAEVKNLDPRYLQFWEDNSELIQQMLSRKILSPDEVRELERFFIKRKGHFPHQEIAKFSSALDIQKIMTQESRDSSDVELWEFAKNNGIIDKILDRELIKRKDLEALEVVLQKGLPLPNNLQSVMDRFSIAVANLA